MSRRDIAPDLLAAGIQVSPTLHLNLRWHEPQADYTELMAFINDVYDIENFFKDNPRTDPPRFEPFIAKDNVYMLIAEDKSGETPELVSVLGFVFNWPKKTLGYSMFAVSKTRARQGIGRKIMAWGEQVARAEGIETIAIETLTTRPELTPFYTKLGFTQTGTTDAPNEGFYPEYNVKFINWEKSLIDTTNDQV